MELPRKGDGALSANTYLVYKDDGSHVAVEAENAQAAIAASGVAKPKRVVRQSALTQHVLAQLPPDKAKAVTAAAAQAAEDAAATEPEPKPDGASSAA
ncbi:MAG: hypothetical protein EBV03_03190 [Proteobacteria bacterium]|nr:hypothetical protein [Pseudomonadota bacterium]